MSKINYENLKKVISHNSEERKKFAEFLSDMGKEEPDFIVELLKQILDDELLKRISIDDLF